MNSESELVINLWESISDNIPPAKRLDAAIKILRAFEGYGFEMSELGHIADEDPLLAKAYAEVAPEDVEDGDYDAEDE